jgi:hypothetical protein
MPEGLIDPTCDYVAAFSRDTAVAWPTIASAHARAIDVRDLLQAGLRQFTSDDVDMGRWLVKNGRWAVMSIGRC